MQKAVFNRDWKVVWHLRTNRIDYYRVGDDPREARALGREGREEQETARALKERHLEGRVDIKPRVSPREIPLRDEREELREKLRSIGYL